MNVSFAAQGGSFQPYSTPKIRSDFNAPHRNTTTSAAHPVKTMGAHQPQQHSWKDFLKKSFDKWVNG